MFSFFLNIDFLQFDATSILEKHRRNHCEIEVFVLLLKSLHYSTFNCKTIKLPSSQVSLKEMTTEGPVSTAEVFI
jgi:hypothetical protein